MKHDLRELLISLKEKDFELREAILKDGSLYDGYDEEMEALHIKNAEKLNEIVTEYGWPGKSLVGEDGSDAAVIIAQHSISKPTLQRKFLEYLKSAVVEGRSAAEAPAEPDRSTAGPLHNTSSDAPFQSSA